MNRDREWWDRFYLGMAELISTASKDPSTKCGAVVVRPDKTVASVGFNGFPKGCSDDPKLYEDREEKLGRVVHAEVNAVLLASEPLAGYTMYTHQTPNLGPTCDRCAACIIQSGITRVVHLKNTSSSAERWRASLERAFQMCAEAGVEIVQL